MMPRLPLVAFGIGLALQVCVPAWQLMKPRPQRLGWQMYSAVLPAPTLVAIGRDGRETLLQRADFLSAPRADFPVAVWRGLPGHVCRVRPAIAAVRYRLRDDAPWEKQPCS